MNNQKVVVTVEIKNTPRTTLDSGYIVARLCDTELWYYGIYETELRAKEVASELGDGVVLESL